ncbi:hypothetical protein EJ06DRAFT_388221 [Trichodelitschia bisporula]|uniref:Nuclear localization protein n=1 Tax=Trichodelitschia bisporula TaxID=703511 RepID=A0A6G1HZQ2_9PEZI|nr:hypothetical protein EJ06DRAFT_388221 [Trichodelitschia bisporula]
MSHPPPPVNGGLGGSILDGSGTINPAALNTSAHPPALSTLSQPSPRGIKRSRSPDAPDPSGFSRPDEDESKPRKRGRPPKSKIAESPKPPIQSLPPLSVSSLAHTPQIKSQALPQTSPPHASPPTKATPAKGTVIKALPTVRDHTTDQLNAEKDEYVPREYDEAGEKKVGPNGEPLEGRVYRCRTFFVPNRGHKLFMLATECARVLGYRDSYLLFNKNRSLYKIIANQAEKDDLIQQDILPYSYRSRQIAIVTARSMFRQFGSRLIRDGRRVRDDYWETKARKQGFTEEDAAGEKRPGAAKQREAAAAAEATSAPLVNLPMGEVIYSNQPGSMDGQAGATLAPLPMINIAPTDDLRPRDYSSVQRPRHEITGPPYQDRTTSVGPTEILNQAQQTAEFNRPMSQQRSNRKSYLEDIWRRPREPQTLPTPEQPAEGQTNVPSTTQTLQSPQIPTTGAALQGQQGIGTHSQPSQSQIIPPQTYTPQSHSQNLLAQSPVRTMHQHIPSNQLHHRSPTMTMGNTPSHTHPQPSNQYGYAQNHMWTPPQPQPSPMTQSHPGIQYPQHIQQQSPHMQQSALHAPPQLHHNPSAASMHGAAPMGYSAMGGMNPSSGYSGVQRNMYQQTPGQQQFMHQNVPSSQPGNQGWSQGPQTHGQQPGWQGGY